MNGWDCWRAVSHFLRGLDGQVVAELHIDDLHASGLFDHVGRDQDTGRILRGNQHATIFPAGDNVTFEHLRRERIITTEWCHVSQQRSASLLGWGKVNFSRHPLLPMTGTM